MSDAPLVMWQMKPVWGLPSPSPFVLKLETWLRMAKIPYTTKAIEGPPKSASGKIPYIERPDGSLLADSSVIIDTLTRERQVKLDEGMSADERALAVLLQRSLEENLYFITLHDRWVDDTHWPRVSRDYFAEFPWLLRKLIVPFVRRKVIQSAWGQGISRLSPEHRLEKGKRDLEAIAHVLGDKPYFFGRPTSFDAIGFAFIAQWLWAPISVPLSEHARASYPAFSAYAERMKAEFWPDWPGTPPT